MLHPREVQARLYDIIVGHNPPGIGMQDAIYMEQYRIAVMGIQEEFYTQYKQMRIKGGYTQEYALRCIEDAWSKHLLR